MIVLECLSYLLDVFTGGRRKASLGFRVKKTSERKQKTTRRSSDSFAPTSEVYRVVFLVDRVEQDVMNAIVRQYILIRLEIKFI